PETSANALIVSASAKNLEKIRALIKQIDTENTGGRKIEFMLLKNAKAVDLAKVLSQVLGRPGRGRRAAGAEPPTVSADAASNALIVAGKKAELETLMAMATQLDQAAIAAGADTHLLPLKNADAAEVAAMLTKLNRDAILAARYAGKAQSVEPVAVSADPRTNVLVVVASEAEFKRISVMVNQIDEMSTRANLQIIQLKNADPNDVLKAIQQIYGSGANGRITRGRAGAARGRTGGAGGVDATVLTGQKALLVNASEQDWKAIQEIVKALDEAADKVKPEVLVFPLAKAPNNRVAQALTSMYRAAQRPGRDEDKVTVVALAGTNAVVVTAAREKMEEVGKLIRQLDGLEIAGEMQFRVFTLENASAAKILPQLQTLIRPLRQARPNQQIEITAEPRANALIVSTQAPVLDEIAKIIKQLDAVPPFKTADILVIPLKSADAPSLADVLTDMLTPGTSKIQTPEAKALQEQVRLLRLKQGKEGLGPLDLTKPIKITSDPQRAGLPGSNCLIVSSTPENLSAVAEIVKVLDTLPIAAGVRVQIVHLKNSDAIAVMQLLQDIFDQGQKLAGRKGTPTAGKAEPESTSGQALVSGLNVTADARTNALIVAGAEESVALATLLINDLDRQPTTEFTEVKVFKLAHADPAQLATLIGQVFAEQPAATPGVAGVQTYVTRLRIARQKDRPLTGKVARSHPTMIVRADPTTNLLVVAARQDLMAIVSELVAQMDIPGAGSLNVVRMYPLKNADATRMAQVITGLYTGPNANLIRPEDRPTITVDTRTNTMVVASSDKTFTVIDAMLRKLDAELAIDLRDIRLVKLDNADATALAPVIQQMMDARVQRQQSLGVGQADALKMVVIADARSNYLIVGGSAEGYKLVAELARQLDDAPAALSGQIQLIALTNANAGTLSSTLTNLFNQRYQAARTPDTPEVQRQRPVMVPDLRTNTLMVAANQDDSRVLQSLIAKLDARPVDPAVQLVVIAMKHNDAGAVGPMIQRVFADRLKAMTPPGQQVAPQDVVSVDVDA
ncbi:MAG: secretin N-terminal domain-containing protein, partial [Planctomycetota bacterium]